MGSVHIFSDILVEIYKGEVQQLSEQHIAWLEQTLAKVLVIGQAFSSEKDAMKLLDLIVAGSMDLTGADAGTLYLIVDPDTHKLSSLRADNRDKVLLEFAIAQNTSMSVVLKSTWTPVGEDSIFGHVILEGKSLRIADAYQLPENVPYRHNRSFDEKTGYRTKSMLTLPMQDHLGNRIGVMQLINKKEFGSDTLDYSQPDVADAILPFTEMDEQLMNALAGQAAIALENAILLQDLKQLLDDYRVQNDELVVLGQRILGAHEDERKRIARELHDGPAQSVANLSMKVEICKRLMAMGDKERLEKEMNRFGDSIGTAVSEIRTILYDLKPAVLEQGLFQAIRTRMVAFEEATGISPSFHAEGEDSQLPEYVISAVYNIVQEALTNVQKYAHAKHVQLKLLVTSAQLIAEVADDGDGFDMNAPQKASESRLKGGFGLQGMRERVELLRGSLVVVSAVGKGTTITVTVPL